MRNGAMSEVHFACFNAVREFDNHRIVSELQGVDVSNMMSRREYVRFLNKTTEDLMYPLPKILEERVKMMNKNKEQGFEDITTTNKKKRKRDKKKKKKKKNEVDYDVSAADLYPDEGSKTELDLTDPVIRADIDDKIRKADELIKQFEKEEEEKQKMKKEKKKNKKKKMKKMKKNEVDDDVSAADHYPGDGSTYKFTKLDLSDPVVRAEMDDKRKRVELLIKQFEREDMEKMKKEEEEEKKKKKRRSKSSSSSSSSSNYREE